MSLLEKGSRKTTALRGEPSLSKNIISSFDKFSQLFSDAADNEEHPRIVALQRYFKGGGVISAMPARGKWPKLIYPPSERLRLQILHLSRQKREFEHSQREWEKRIVDAKLRTVKNKFFKYADPIFWKHVAKVFFDHDYRQDAHKVKLPLDLVSEKRWKPMIRMFVDDLDYRKQLTEAVEHSIVYKQDKRLAKFANELLDFRKNLSERKSGHFREKAKELEDDIWMLEQIHNWAKD